MHWQKNSRHKPLPIPDAAPVMTAVCEASFNQDAIAFLSF
jgi:hypothetical protein